MKLPSANKTLRVVISAVFIAATYFPGQAQSDKLEFNDSLRVANERGALAEELIQLRDSISISLLAFDSQIQRTLPSKGYRLIIARNELLACREQIELDLEEALTTSQNSWSDHSLTRIKLATQNSRRTHKRVSQIL